MTAKATVIPPHQRTGRRLAYLAALVSLVLVTGVALAGAAHAAPRSDEGAALNQSAALWTLIAPTGWAAAPVSVNVSVYDADFPDATTSEYRLSTDGGVTWAAWQSGAALQYTQVDAYTVQMTATLAGLAESASANRVQLRVQDALATVETSPSYTLQVDNAGPLAPVSLATVPASWTNVNSFALNWGNPADVSGIARAFSKVSATAPTGPTDFTSSVTGANVSSMSGLTAPAPGAHTVYVWLEDGAGYNAYTRTAQSTLYLDTAPPAAPIGLSASPSTWTATNAFDLSWTNPAQAHAAINRAYWKFDTAPASNTDFSGYADGPNIQVLNDLAVPGSGAIPCYVWLEDAAGNTDYGTAVSVTLYYSGGAAPGAPIGLQLVPTAWVNVNAYDVSWTNPTVPSGIQAAWYKWGAAPTGPENGTRLAGAGISELLDLAAPAEGENTLHVWLEDGAGVKDHTQRSSATARYDATPPETTYSFDPALPATGWFSSTVSLQLAPTDVHSGVAITYYRPEGDLLWKTGTSVAVSDYVTYTWKSVDNAGNEEQIRSLLVPIDTVPPTTTLTLDPPEPASGWYTGTLTATLSVEDDRSGWQGDTYYRLDGGTWTLGTTVNITADGLHSLEYYSRDVAGNTEATQTSPDLKIDGLAPTVTATPQTEDWFVPPVTIAFEASDVVAGVVTSGVEAVEYRKLGNTAWITGTEVIIDGLAGDGPYTYEYRARDVAGNVMPTDSITVNVDGTPPGQPTDLAATPTGWVNVNDDFGATWTNPPDASGIAGAYFKIDGDPITDPTPSGFVELADIQALSGLSVADDGAHSLYVWLVDNAGNHDPYMRAALADAFKLDRAAPVLTAPSLQGPLGEDGLHYRGPVTVTLSASDALSGIGSIHYQIESEPVVDVPVVGAPSSAQHTVVLFAEGARQQLRFWATDAATNAQGVAQSVAVRFDSLAPTAPLAVAVTPSVWSATNSFTVTWTNPVDYSGVASAYYKRGSAPVNGTDGTKYTLPAFGETTIEGIALTTQGATPLHLWLKDVAGNVDHTTAVSVTLRWDATAPTTQIQAEGTLRNGFYITPLALRFTSNDTASGVLETRYRINGGAEQVWSGQDVLLGQDGAYTVSYYSVDEAGNIETTRQAGPYKVDRNAPRVLLRVAADYVTASSVLVSWAGDDGADGSGVARYTVEVRAGGCNAWTPWLVDTVNTQTWYVDSMLRNTFYYFRVKCVDAAGHQSAYSPATKSVVYRDAFWNGTFGTCTTQSWYPDGALGASVGQYPDRTGGQNCMGLLGQPKGYTDGVAVNASGSLSTGTAIQLPSLACDSGLVLSFWYRIRSWDTAWGLDVDDNKEKWFDPFWVYVRRGDNPSEVLGTFLPDGNLTDRTLWQPETLYDSGWRNYILDLTPWAGQSVFLDFRVWNMVDGQLATWVYIDDIRLMPARSRVVSLPVIANKVSGGQTPLVVPTLEAPAAVLPSDSWSGEGIKPRN